MTSPEARRSRFRKPLLGMVLGTPAFYTTRALRDPVVVDSLAHDLAEHRWASSAGR